MLLLSAKTNATLIVDQAFQASVAFPPAGSWADVSSWIKGGAAPAEFDLEIWANATINLTNAELFGGSLHPVALADDDVDDNLGNPTVDATANTATVTGHAYVNGDGPVQLETTGTMPGALATLTDYWLIVVDANTVKFATSLANAMAGTEVNITSVGTGTLTITDTDDTQRLHWHSEGLLGKLGDGAVALTSVKAYRTRRAHRARALFYALVATMSAENPEWISAAVYPLQDA